MDKPLFFKNTDGKFLFIRHGQTVFNQDQTSENKLIIKTQAEYIDSHLSEKGISQAKSICDQVGAFDVEAVYVSPLTRALQTAFYVFENHPQRDKIVIKVHPFITETVNGVHDFSCDIDERKNKFNMESKVKFDWSIFDSFFDTKRRQDLYYMEYMDNFNDEQKKEIFGKVYQAYDTGNKEILLKSIANMSKYAVDLGLLRCESLKAMLQRGNKFELFLKDTYKETEKDLKRKVITITHSSLCKVLTSPKAYYMKEIPDFPDDCYMMKNCEIISMNI